MTPAPVEPVISARSPAIVVAGGDPISAHRVRWPADALVIAADSGLHLATELGLAVDVVVGDLDSATPEAVAAAEEAGAAVERHPTRKDATDLALALAVASERGCDAALVVGLGGGRLDHLLGGLLVLAAPALSGMAISAVTDDAVLTVVRGERTLSGRVGSLVTLLAVGGAAAGVTTTGLEYPLDGETLEPLSTRGVSNVLVDATATVRVERGVVLAIQTEED